MLIPVHLWTRRCGWVTWMPPILYWNNRILFKVSAYYNLSKGGFLIDDVTHYSFGYPTTNTDTTVADDTTHLSNQLYQICIRRTSGTLLHTSRCIFESGPLFLYYFRILLYLLYPYQWHCHCSILWSKCNINRCNG